MDLTQPRGPVDASRIPRYAGPETFARLPRVDEVSRPDVTVVGVPFDSGVSYRPGARFGPAHIRAGSKLLRPYNAALDVHPFGSQQVADVGDIAVNPFDLEEALTSVDVAVTRMRRDGSRLLTLGGDHSIALPVLRSLARDHGPVAVLHFDAHLDTWDTYFGAPYTHGTPFRRASEEGLTDLERSLHMGIRGPLYSSEDLEDDRVLGFQVIRADDYEVDGVARAVDRMLGRLADGPVYVSVDIDVLDPAHAPGTGTPEAGGLTSRELLNTLRGLAGLDIVGADIVEVAPAYDHAEITAIAAAHVAYELLTVMALGNPTREQGRYRPARPLTHRGYGGSTGVTGRGVAPGLTTRGRRWRRSLTCPRSASSRWVGRSAVPICPLRKRRSCTARMALSESTTATPRGSSTITPRRSTMWWRLRLVE